MSESSNTTIRQRQWALSKAVDFAVVEMAELAGRYPAPDTSDLRQVIYVVMSASRRNFTAEYQVESARRVIDSGRSIPEVARELYIGEQSLGTWVRDENRLSEASKGTELEPLTGAERAAEWPGPW